ncbi:MAG: hypothetical protein KDA60_08970, partial [Planctomycetales bacterium]|nr:hypothetical protein [Planctomycetales bacterium]
MNLRVTSQNITAQAIKYSQSHGSTISRLQQQIATGRRINRPSDDPSITRALLSDKLAVSRVDVQVGNIEAARNRLNVSVSQLLSANELLVRAKDIALESPQEFDRALLADQVDVMLNELVNIANTQVDGEYLFSGTAIETQPFQLVRSADGSHVQYRGAQDRSQIVVGFELAVDVLFAGDEVFASTSRRPTEFLGQTGAQAGKGTDTASGRGQLVVRHGATSYDAGSGVVPSASSPTNDTIVGAAGAHKLTVNDLSGNGTSGVVTLNDGIAVPFSSADTDLEVVGPKGERVFIDMSAITAGFNGTVAITSTGTLSVDGGATEFPIDGSDN